MAPSHETLNLDWNRQLIEPAPDVEPTSAESGDAETEPADAKPDDSTKARLVPRAQCRECTEQLAVRGLCIACFVK